MKKILFIIALAFLCFSNNLYSQRVGFISSDQIRELFPEAKQADQRIQTIEEEWKREIKEMDQLIQAKEFEIQKNRLVWTDDEKKQNQAELEGQKEDRMVFAKIKYSVGGEYDQIVKALAKPVEEKIFAAVQKVAAEEGYDIVWDKSTQPLAYVNFKYDLTVKVLKELGVDTEQLEKDLMEKIDKDPRNQQKSKETPEKRTRKRKTDSKDIEKDEPEEQNQIDSQEKKTSENSEEIINPEIKKPKK